LLASVLGGFGSNVGFGKQDGRADVARLVRGRSAPVRKSSVGELTLVDKSQRYVDVDLCSDRTAC
jgi:hypothetical protein